MAETRAARLLTPAFVTLTLSDLLYFTGGGVLIAATPLFVTGPLGSTEAGVGLAMGSFSVSTLLLRPWAGRWTDRHGRRRLLVGGAALFAVVTLGHLFVHGLAALIALRLLLGAAEAMYFVAGFAALADLAPPKRAGEALSLNSLALYVGVAAGPLLGQVLLERAGFHAAWLGAATLVAAGALLATRVPETCHPSDEPTPPTPWLHHAAFVPGIGLLCGVAAMSGFFAFAVLRAQAVGISRWSTVLIVFGGTVILCRLVFARLPDRVGADRLAARALAVAAAGLLLAGAVDNPFGLVSGAVVLAVGMAFVTPAVFATVFGAVAPAERGSAAATTSIFMDLGFGGGPMVFGALAAASSIGAAFVIAATLPALGSLLLVRRARHPAPATAPI